MIKKNKVGNTNLEITEIGIGTAPIGGWPVEVSADQARLTLEKAWSNGIRFFDTAPLYGSGMAEERLGNFLKEKNRDEFVISTKVGRLIVPSKTGSSKFKGSPTDRDAEFNFSYDGAMRSFEMSLKRTGLDRFDVLHLHDPDNFPEHYKEALNGTLKAMIKLKEEKVVQAIGCGLNQNEMLIDLAKEGCFDCFLLAGRYTLLDQTSLDQLIPICEKNNISLIIGGVFNSGILIKPSPKTFFDYTLLDEHWYENAKVHKVRIPKNFENAEYWLKKAYKLEEVCKKYNVSLKKTALQFPYFNKIVSTVIIGMSSPKEVEENIENYNSKVPDDLWKEIKKLNLIDERSFLNQS